MSRCYFALLVLAPLVIVAACDDDDVGSGNAFDVPDGSSADFDAPATGDVDATVQATVPGFIGTVGGNQSNDRCPTGQLAIGLAGGSVPVAFYSGVLSQVTTVCGTLVLPQAGTTEVTIAPGATVPADTQRGITPATMPLVTVTCPANQIVVGLAGSAVSKDFPPRRNLTASAQLRCASLSYAGGAFAVGVVSDGPTLGAAGDGGAAGPFDCPAGQVAVGSYVQAGEILDGIGPLCAPAQP